MRRLIKRFFRCLFRTAWWQPNKKSRKILKEEAKELIGYDQTVNPAWFKSWKYFIKRQYPWCGLIELIQFKIIEMRDYMQNYSHIVEEETEKQIKEMTEVIELGKKILKDDYDNYAHAWNAANSVQVTLVYKKIDNRAINYNKGDLLVKLYNTGMFDELFLEYGGKENFNEDVSDKAHFLKDKNITKLKDWLKENNLTKNDVNTAYTSEWSNGKPDKENHDYFFYLLKKAAKERQTDINNYFKLIAKHYDGWGD